MRTTLALAAALLLLAAPRTLHALELHAERGSPYDLGVRGMLAGVPAGELRYVRWADLRALPTDHIKAKGEFMEGPQELTVVFLDVLWKALPVLPGADCVQASCADGYTSVFTLAFISSYRPFVVLEINGKGPKDWPPPGVEYNPGPFAISVSDELVPAVDGYRDIEHKEPWNVTRIEIASYAKSYAAIYSGRWADLSPGAKDGREIWVNSCASCHQGPGGIFGGTKADRPFGVIAAYAAFDAPFFREYVRDPKALVPCAKMEPHPKYVDNELSNLIAFITSGQQR